MKKDNKFILFIYLFVYLIIFQFNTFSHPDFKSFFFGENHKNPVDNEVIQEAMDDLLDDGMRWNLGHGKSLLRHYIEKHDLPFYKIIPLLHSDDYQQRHAIAYMIREHKPGYISDRLLEVLVEGLQDDHHPWEDNNKYHQRGIYSWINNAEFGLEELQKPILAKYAKKFLVDGCYSDDSQQNFLCAVLLVKNNMFHENSNRIIDILIDNTKDDGIYENCKISLGALYKMGNSICPYLLKKYEEIDGFDLQEKNSIRYLFHHFNYLPQGWKNVKSLGGSRFDESTSYFLEGEELNEQSNILGFMDHWLEGEDGDIRIFRW